MVSVHPTLLELAAAIRRLKPSTQAYNSANRVWIKEELHSRSFTRPLALSHLVGLSSNPEQSQR